MVIYGHYFQDSLISCNKVIFIFISDRIGKLYESSFIRSWRWWHIRFLVTSWVGKNRHGRWFSAFDCRGISRWNVECFSFVERGIQRKMCLLGWNNFRRLSFDPVWSTKCEQIFARRNFRVYEESKNFNFNFKGFTFVNYAG